jgi:16S rRNA (guanine527-N7)-methyltransferase
MGLVEGSERTVDLGSGAGFPGVPLKAASPGLAMDLAEAVGKKCAWLNHLLRTLELTNARVLGGRFEELLEEGRARQYDLVVSRAAAKPKELCRFARLFLAPGGKALIYTTRALVEEGVGTVHPYTISGSKVPSVIWEVEFESKDQRPKTKV